MRYVVFVWLRYIDVNDGVHANREGQYAGP
jgi:hypothetical protein